MISYWVGFFDFKRKPPCFQILLLDSLCQRTFILCHIHLHICWTYIVLPGSLQVGITPENSHSLGLQEGFSQTAPSLTPEKWNSLGIWIKQLVSVQREMQRKPQTYSQHLLLILLYHAIMIRNNYKNFPKINNFFPGELNFYLAPLVNTFPHFE